MDCRLRDGKETIAKMAGKRLARPIWIVLISVGLRLYRAGPELPEIHRTDIPTGSKWLIQASEGGALPYQPKERRRTGAVTCSCSTNSEL